MMDITTELKKLLELIEIEKEEDLFQFREMVLLTPLEERKEEGISWYPVIICDEDYNFHGKRIVEVERRQNRDEPHSFTKGCIVSLFANIESRAYPPFVTGVITKVMENKIKICLDQNELPSWIDKHTLGLDLAHDEKTFIEMRKAVQNIIEAKNNRPAQLREILLGKSPAKFKDKEILIQDQSLNDSQQNAIKKVLQAEDVAIIHGPPGTGKTTTLIAAIEIALSRERQVLVCAPSNAAVDLLATKLLDKNIDILRLGHPARTSSHLTMYTFDAKIAQHPMYKTWKKLRKKALELREEALKYKRHFDAQKRQERYQKLGEAKEIFSDADRIEDMIFQDVIDQTQVIVCTLVGASNDRLAKKRFSTVFIDEAVQAMEPACWIPILLSDRVIFAGDHCQLPPTIKSRKAEQEGLSFTLMEKCLERQNNVISMLTIQYRMHEKIMNFSNSYFYNNKLVAHETVKDHLLCPEEQPVEFIDTAGFGADETLNEKTKSLSNQGEADLLKNHLTKLLQKEIFQQQQLTIGVIAPYKEQASLLRKTLKDITPPEKTELSIQTVDSFQGQERDIIYISLVRSNEKQEIGFLADIRRMNVAMTRAKKKLVVIGDSATMSSHPFYKQFFDYIDTINAYQSAYEL